MINGYAEGSNITILDTIYRYPHRTTNGDGYEDDFISILYKDNDTGRKSHQVIYKPDYEYYKLKDNIQLDHNLLFIEKDKVIKRTVEYSSLLKDIAEQTNNTEFFYNNIRNGNRAANKRLLTSYNIFNADMKIDDHYRARFDKLYKNEPCPISKAYFDIEVDSISAVEDFPELGECPINAVSYIFDNKITSFLLRDSKNPLIEKFEKSIDRNLFTELNDFIIENVGGIEKAKKYKVDNLEYEFLFYDEEICLIHELFEIINKNEPDFLLAWNMAFDIPYIVERLLVLGYEPEDILCHPSFSKDQRIVKCFIDERHMNEYEARGDRYTITSHTVYLDQLIHFASRRKGQSKFPNFKLDTAGEIIAGVRKLDYSHITTRIEELPYLDYKTFVFYNIMDTIVQKCIEEKVADIDYIYNKCLINNTSYDKGHRQTVYLGNRGIKKFYKDGYIMGNNVNVFAERQEDNPDNPTKNKKEFGGALVGDPTHNSDYSKVKIGNQCVNIIDNADDYDFKALYPSIQRENNMAPNTQIGKIIIPDPVHVYENPYNYEYYDRGGQFIEDFISEDVVSFSNRWLNFPTFREYVDHLYKYFTTIDTPSNLHWDHRQLMVKIPDGYLKPLMTISDNRWDEDYLTPLMVRYTKPINYNEYLNKMEAY